jgi:hypothetical protein
MKKNEAIMHPQAYPHGRGIGVGEYRELVMKISLLVPF